MLLSRAHHYIITKCYNNNESPIAVILPERDRVDSFIKRNFHSILSHSIEQIWSKSSRTTKTTQTCLNKLKLYQFAFLNDRALLI